MTYLESVLSRLPDSVFEALDSLHLHPVVRQDFVEIGFLDKAKTGFTGSFFDIMLDGVEFYIWPPKFGWTGAVSGDHLIAVGQFVEEMNAIAYGDFIEKASEGGL